MGQGKPGVGVVGWTGLGGRGFMGVLQVVCSRDASGGYLYTTMPL